MITKLPKQSIQIDKWRISLGETQLCPSNSHLKWPKIKVSEHELPLTPWKIRYSSLYSLRAELTSRQALQMGSYQKLAGNRAYMRSFKLIRSVVNGSRRATREKVQWPASQLINLPIAKHSMRIVYRRKRSFKSRSLTFSLTMTFATWYTWETSQTCLMITGQVSSSQPTKMAHSSNYWTIQAIFYRNSKIICPKTNMWTSRRPS